MQVIPVESTALATVGYDEARELLRVEFCGRAIYHYFGVPGLAATVERWQRFDSDWAKMLKDYGLTSFHAKHYIHSKEQFEGWKGDDAKRRLFMERAINIITRRCMVAVGIVLDKAVFQKTIGQDELVSSFYVNEYCAAAFMSLLVAGRWADGCAFHDPVDYVFDRGNPQRSDFQRAYDLALKVPEERGRLGALSFADDEQLTALQAADLIAYESCKIVTDLKSGTKRFRGSMRALLGKMRCDIKVTSEEALTKLVKEMKARP